MTRVVLSVVLLAAMAGAAPAGQKAAKTAGPSPGRGTIVVGSYSGHLTAVDEATGAITKTTLTTGAPFVVRLSPDRSRFYVQSANQEKFEIVDAATRTSVDSFTLSDARTHVRPMAFEPDPQHRTMVFVTRADTKQIDRWTIGEPELVVYDLASHTVVRRHPWPIDPEPGLFGVALRFSPDGKLLYVFADTISVLDVATMQVVDTWDLALPEDPALGSFAQGPWTDEADEPGTATSLFIQRDAIQKRKMLVVGRIDLAKKTVAVTPIGPEPVAHSLGFHVAPDRTRGHLLLGDIGHHELWTIDLAAGKVVGRQEVPSRTRMQMRSSTSGEVLYIYEAGRTIELYTADAKTKLRTIELDSDMMYATFTLLPAAAPATTSK